MTPKISIIIPTFNRADLLPKALNSVLLQTYRQWECIVVDDGSEDNTLELLSEYQVNDSRINYYRRHREPKGAPTCRNIGLENAKGDYVLFLDSDDYLLPFCLEQRINQTLEYPQCDFLVFPMAESRLTGLVRKSIPFYDNYVIPFLEANLPWQTMCPLWKRSFLLQLSGFTEGYPRFNDPELMIRALLQKKVIFEVFNNFKFDCVHQPAPQDSFAFANKVYQSLHLFIPDMIKALNHAGKDNLKGHLALYLHLWFKYVYSPRTIKGVKQSLILVARFNRQNIISRSKMLNIYMRLIVLEVTAIFVKQPINKLTYRSLYRSL